MWRYRSDNHDRRSHPDHDRSSADYDGRSR
jgi:hypothetical protein